MKRGRKPNPLFTVPEGIAVILHPVPEPAAEFQKRTKEVQEMLAKIMLLSKKRGRPSTKEDEYEKVA